MKPAPRLLTALLLALPALAHAHPGHEGGHELTWDFHGHGLIDSPLALIIIASLATAALLARYARRRS